MAYRVYFGRLPESLSQDDFEKMLVEHGKAKNIDWKSGYAYVDYKHSSDASKTVQNLNGKEVSGNNILVELAQNGGRGYAIAGTFAPRPFVKPPPSRPIRTPHRVRIENLSSRAKWMELKELLSLAGEVTFADTHKRKTGEGIVEFATKKDLDEAIKTFHNTTFFGKTIKLYDESPNRGRSRSPGRKKSRSHSRHRSPERKRRTRSKSPSPRRKPSSRRRSPSPRKRSPRRRSGSKDRNRSRRRRSRSRSPTKSSRNSHKKSKKSKRDSSPRSRSKSPRSRKHKSRSNSRSGSDNNNDSKRKSTKKRSLSNSNSDSDTKSK